jgi:hypothetical protein
MCVPYAHQHALLLLLTCPFLFLYTEHCGCPQHSIVRRDCVCAPFTTHAQRCVAFMGVSFQVQAQLRRAKDTNDQLEQAMKAQAAQQALRLNVLPVDESSPAWMSPSSSSQPPQPFLHASSLQHPRSFQGFTTHRGIAAPSDKRALTTPALSIHKAALMKTSTAGPETGGPNQTTPQLATPGVAQLSYSRGTGTMPAAQDCTPSSRPLAPRSSQGGTDACSLKTLQNDSPCPSAEPQPFVGDASASDRHVDWCGGTLMHGHDPRLTQSTGVSKERSTQHGFGHEHTYIPHYSLGQAQSAGGEAASSAYGTQADVDTAQQDDSCLRSQQQNTVVSSEQMNPGNELDGMRCSSGVHPGAVEHSNTAQHGGWQESIGIWDRPDSLPRSPLPDQPVTAHPYRSGIAHSFESPDQPFGTRPVQQPRDGLDQHHRDSNPSGNGFDQKVGFGSHGYCFQPAATISNLHGVPEGRSAPYLMTTPPLEAAPEATSRQPSENPIQGRRAETVQWEERLKAAELRLEMMRLERSQMHAQVAESTVHGNSFASTGGGHVRPPDEISEQDSSMAAAACWPKPHQQHASQPRASVAGAQEPHGDVGHTDRIPSQTSGNISRHGDVQSPGSTILLSETGTQVQGVILYRGDVRSGYSARTSGLLSTEGPEGKQHMLHTTPAAAALPVDPRHHTDSLAPQGLHNQQIAAEDCQAELLDRAAPEATRSLLEQDTAIGVASQAKLAELRSGRADQTGLGYPQSGGHWQPSLATVQPEIFENDSRTDHATKAPQRLVSFESIKLASALPRRMTAFGPTKGKSARASAAVGSAMAAGARSREIGPWDGGTACLDNTVGTGRSRSKPTGTGNSTGIHKSLTGALDEAMQVLESEIALATPSRRSKTAIPKGVADGHESYVSQSGRRSEASYGLANTHRQRKADLVQLARMDPRDLSSQHESRSPSRRVLEGA